MNNESDKNLDQLLMDPKLRSEKSPLDSKKIILETDRLILRQMDRDDFENLRRFLGDPEVMYAYEHGFDEEEIRQWIERNLRCYAADGFGL